MRHLLAILCFILGAVAPLSAQEPAADELRALRISPQASESMLLDGLLYGSGCRLYKKGFVCVELAGGKTLWNERRIGKVSITWADGMLYAVDDRGKVSLLDASPKGCRVVSQFQLPRKSGKLTLCHPVVCGGRLYLRDWNELLAYDLRAAPGK